MIIFSAKGSPLQDANEVIMNYARGGPVNKKSMVVRRGIVNLGTTCWIASVVQCVAQTQLAPILTSMNSISNIIEHIM